MSAPWGNVWGRAWMLLTPIEVPPDGVRSGRVQVWRADLDHPPVEMDTLERTLSGDERARAGRFHRPCDRNRSVAARGLLRFLLGDALGCLPSDVRFRYNAHGKPALASSHARLGFNLSHSAGVALFALAWDREVGVDIERVPAAIDVGTLTRLEQYMPADEAVALLSLPLSSLPLAFCRAWVRGEAYCKALGTGFPDAPLPQGQTQWACLDLDVGPEYRAALVLSETESETEGTRF